MKDSAAFGLQVNYTILLTGSLGFYNADFPPVSLQGLVLACYRGLFGSFMFLMLLFFLW